MSDQSFMPNDRERPMPSTTRLPKKVVVEWRARPGRVTLFFRDWSKFGAYTNLKRANQVLKAKDGDPHFEYRIRG